MKHENPFPSRGGIQVQEKLLGPGSSSHTAFSSHGVLVQSSVRGMKQGRGDGG